MQCPEFHFRKTARPSVTSTDRIELLRENPARCPKLACDARSMPAMANASWGEPTRVRGQFWTIGAISKRRPACGRCAQSRNTCRIRTRRSHSRSPTSPSQAVLTVAAGWVQLGTSNGPLSGDEQRWRPSLQVTPSRRSAGLNKCVANLQGKATSHVRTATPNASLRVRSW
jgi:hypothetical protein